MTVKYIRLEGGITVAEAVRALGATMDPSLMSPGMRMRHAEGRKYHEGSLAIRYNTEGRIPLYFVPAQYDLPSDWVEVKPREVERVYEGGYFV